MAIELEHDLRSLPIDENLTNTLAELAAEGWQMAPGVRPVAVYYLIRVKNDGQVITAAPKVAPVVAAEARGKLILDESKVHIVRNGKIIS